MEAGISGAIGGGREGRPRRSRIFRTASGGWDCDRVVEGDWVRLEIDDFIPGVRGGANIFVKARRASARRGCYLGR